MTRIQEDNRAELLKQAILQDIPEYIKSVTVMKRGHELIVRCALETRDYNPSMVYNIIEHHARHFYGVHNCINWGLKIWLGI